MAVPALAKHLTRIGLEANPFPVTPDASRYFLSEKMDVHLTELLHCIEARKGFMLVTADIGLGKTTLTRRLIKLLTEQEMQVSLVFNSFLHGVELLEAINRDLSVVVEGGIGEQLSALNDYLLTQFNQQKNVIIILDDAQNLNIESLDLLRQISNLETNEHKLVQILLVAQPEIMTTLSYPEIRQLKSRIALHIEMMAFSQNETISYVNYRLKSVVNSQNIHLTPSAFRRLQSASKGYPRQINLIMDRALYGVALDRKNRINTRLIKQAVNDINRIQNTQKKSSQPLFYSAAMVVIALLVLSWDHIPSIPRLFSSDLAATEVVLVGSEHKLENEVKLTQQQQDNTDFEVAAIERVANNVQTVQESQIAVDVKTQQFLNYYKLSTFAESLQQAIERQHYAPVEQQFGQSDWALLHFATKVAGNTLRISDEEGHDEWLLLWRLPYKVEDFNFGSESQGITQLQIELNQLGLYSGKLDGVVGSLTIAAVAQFQRMVGLPPSGQLSSKTRYFLYQAVL